MEIFIVLLIGWLSVGFYSGEVSHQKGYSGAACALGGFLIIFIALIASAGLPDKKLRKYRRLIEEKQNALKVVKETVEVVRGNTKISFSMPKDSSKEEIYKELVSVLKEGGCKLEKYNLNYYDLDMDNWDKEFIVNSDEKDRLIVLDGKKKETNKLVRKYINETLINYMYF